MKIGELIRSVTGSVLTGIGIIGVAMGRGGGKLQKDFPGIWIGCVICGVIGLIIFLKKPVGKTIDKSRKKKQSS